MTIEPPPAVDAVPQAGALSSTKAPRRKVVAWAFWDWGTQPFATVITTFVFSVYLTSSAFGEKDQVTIQLAWATGTAGLLIALLAPVLGQGADRTGKRMFHLRWQTWLLAAICAAMYFVAPAPEYFLLGAVLLGAGNVVSEIANVNYYSALDQVSTPSDVGRVSGLGWGLGYLGGITILLVIIGVLGSDFTPDDVRLSMLICGAWTLLFTIPIFIALKDRKPDHVPPSLGIVGSYRELFRSIARVGRDNPNTLFFLVASALFRDGLAGVFTFGGVLAAGTFGFTFGEVVIFGVVANVVAGLATMLFGLLDDRLGPKRVILFSLGMLVALGLGHLLLPRRRQDRLLDLRPGHDPVRRPGAVGQPILPGAPDPRGHERRDVRALRDDGARGQLPGAADVRVDDRGGCRGDGRRAGVEPALGHPRSRAGAAGRIHRRAVRQAAAAHRRPLISPHLTDADRRPRAEGLQPFTVREGHGADTPDRDP